MRKDKQMTFSIANATLLLFGGIIIVYVLNLKYKKFNKIFNMVAKASNGIYLMVSKTKVNSEYKDLSLVITRYLSIVKVLNNPNYPEKAKTRWLSVFMFQSYKTLTKGKEVSYDHSVQMAKVIMEVLANDEALLEMVESFKDSDNIEVKKITILMIDCLSKAYDLQKKLDRSAFKHVVYGLNLVLIKLREDGYSKDTFNKVGLILKRLLVVLRAYDSLNLTKTNSLNIKQLHFKVSKLMSDISEVITWVK